MKRFILILILVCIGTISYAINIKVEALSSFSTANPKTHWQLKTLEDIEIKDKGTIPAGSIINGKIEDVQSPARCKRDAKFKFIPISIEINETEYKIVRNFDGEYNANKMNAGNIAKQGAVVVGNKIFKGLFGPGIAIVEGAVKNESGNVAKSAITSLYESTPLSYIEKGKEIEINEGQQFVMNFKEDN